MGDTTKLNKEKTIQLIWSYRRKEALWNIHSILYKQLDSRRKAWEQLSAEFNLSIETLKKKIKCLRTSYMYEKKKVEASRNSDCGGVAYVSNLFYYQEMEFLNNSSPIRNVTEGVPMNISYTQPNTIEVTENKIDSNIEIIEFEDSTSNVSTVNEYAKDLEIKSKILKNQQKLRSKKKTRKHKKSLLSEAVKMLKELNKEVEDQDEYSIFGKLIACRIRNLKTQYAKITVQHLINNIMYDAQLGKFNGPTRYEADRNSL